MPCTRWAIKGKLLSVLADQKNASNGHETTNQRSAAKLWVWLILGGRLIYGQFTEQNTEVKRRGQNKMAVSRKKNMVPAFNLVPVVEQFFSDRQVS